MNNSLGMPTVVVVGLLGVDGGGCVGREKDAQAPSTLNPGFCSLPFSFLASSLGVEEPECIWRPRWSLSGFSAATVSVPFLQMGKLREAQAKPLPARALCTEGQI